MKIQKVGEYTADRKLIIEANCFDDGYLIDKWHEQIKEHMDKLNFNDINLEKETEGEDGTI